MATGWAPGELVEGGHELAVAVEPEHGVDFGEGGGHIDAEALGHAPDHHRPRPGPAGFLDLEDRLDRLATGVLDEGAGVDHDHVGFVRTGGGEVSRLGQHGVELLRVDLVLGAAQGGQVVGGAQGRSRR
jgi:hypothetical protein